MTEPAIDRVLWGWAPYTVDNDANTIEFLAYGDDGKFGQQTVDTTGYEVYVAEFQPKAQDADGYVYDSALVLNNPVIEVVLHPAS